MRKKKPQQNDEEKLQALLQSWNIPLPDKKPDFPQTSTSDFPKADFPEAKPEPRKEKFNLHQEIPEEKVNLKKEISEKKVTLQKEIPPQKVKPKKEPPFEAFFDKQKKKPVTPESILNQNSDLDKLFKKQVIQYLHGTVRMITLGNFLLLILMIYCSIQMLRIGGILAFLSIFGFICSFIWLWYILSWKLTFNGDTNRFSYSSLFHQETQFHASEIQNLRIEKHYARASLKHVMILSVHQKKIIIALGYPNKQEYFDGFPDALKLQQYLEIYQELYGKFHYSGFIEPDRISDSPAKQELMDLLAAYQNQIDQKNKE